MWIWKSNKNNPYRASHVLGKFSAIYIFIITQDRVRKKFLSDRFNTVRLIDGTIVVFIRKLNIFMIFYNSKLL